jgi:MATE family multidrug resistance protein
MRFLNVLGFTVFLGILARVGVAQLAAHVVVIRIISVSFLPGHAISEATSVLVGQAVGADSPLSARLAHRFSTFLALIVMASWALVFVFIPEPLINVFDAGIQVSLIAQELMCIGALFQVLDAVAMVALGALNGAGDTRFTMIITVTCAWLVQIPLGLFLAFSMDLGAAGAWWGITVEILLIAIIGVWRIQGDHWLEHQANTS